MNVQKLIEGDIRMQYTGISRRIVLALLTGSVAFFSMTAQAEPVSVSSIAQRLQPFVDDGTIPGAVTLVASKNKVLSLEAVGYADVSAKKPMAIDCEFWIASMTKAITAAGLMILVDQGKVNLDDAVSKYIPEFANDKTWVIVPMRGDTQPQPPTPTHDITVREILSHTAGLRATSRFESPTLDLYPLSDRVASYTKMPLLSDPGTEYSYANSGINTAGRIIEIVSGEPYAQFLQERIFGPLGMTDTTFFPSKEQISRLALSYSYNAQTNILVPVNIGQLKYPLDDPSRQPMPAGGLFATAVDVARFCQMLLRGGVDPSGKRILSREAVTTMTTKQTGPLVKTPYGFGLAVSPVGYGHGGAYSTDMEVDAKRGIISVFMVQMAGWNKDARAKLGNAYNGAVAQFPAQQEQ